jgi:hypothetical protein
MWTILPDLHAGLSLNLHAWLLAKVIKVAGTEIHVDRDQLFANMAFAIP